MRAILCRRCDGYGEIRHRRYGQATCPDPTEPCPDCDGIGGTDLEPQACHECGRSSEVTEPTETVDQWGDPRWLCRKCRDAEAAELVGVS